MINMEVYINECSIHGQYHDQVSFDTALQNLYQVLDLLRKQKVEFQTYKTEVWQIYQAIKTTPFIAAVNAMKRRDLRIAFFRILHDGLNAKDWQQVRIHSPDDLFTYNDEIVTNTSMAEVAERAAQNTETLYLLINFQRSKFTGSLLVKIIKNEEDETSIDCVDHHAELSDWLEVNFQLSRSIYNYDSDRSPTDQQTLLIDNKRFAKTSRIYDGRAIYREVDTGRYWYVDNLHVGYAAHIEVFDGNGNHLGEADLTGEVDWAKSDPGKRLHL